MKTGRPSHTKKYEGKFTNKDGEARRAYVLYSKEVGGFVIRSEDGRPLSKSSKKLSDILKSGQFELDGNIIEEAVAEVKGLPAAVASVIGLLLIPIKH